MLCNSLIVIIVEYTIQLFTIIALIACIIRKVHVGVSLAKMHSQLKQAVNKIIQNMPIMLEYNL